MSFFQRLIGETQADQQAFLSRDVFRKTREADVSLGDYQAFLTQAYHHVKHTVPLLMACGSRLPQQYHWLQAAVAEYIEEEIGHEQWILNDLGEAGGERDRVPYIKPHPSTEVMVAYAYHQIERVNPLAFFGMVHVLEGTSTAMATETAAIVQQALNLPDSAFSYLRSHGSLDIEHVAFFERLMNKITDQDDQDCIIHATKMFYRLYGEVLSSAIEVKDE
ncbi:MULTISPECIES: iron-containing redox enzyme family protein [unclassified Motilimonas]|uniref:TenA family transcriptional regulator n=1 Tax=unclassified Motilimonas TaxID=2643697 RepID=UPI001E38A1F4|nr:MULTISPECIES: iron-containing redox enzyme family protein [unclassified Motilimonas]MCE0558162.1 iron-containing redox enzyme family protein [Motilimonas sp. E26]MDO6524521.1 iron-containing redox enzyme family protein [Motilimonas sp. 1_MG-2023]